MVDAALIRSALDLADKARECLKTSQFFIREKIIKTKDKIWGADKYLNGSIEPKEKGLYGTACSISALVYCGELPDSELLQNCVRLLLSDTFKIRGGWSTSTIKKQAKTAMVNATCYALNALLNAGIDPRSPEIQKGLDWLTEARNPSLRWGRYPADTQDQLTATCNAMATITSAVGPESNVSVSDFAEALSWIRGNQDPESGGWPKRKPNAGSTAIAILALAGSSTDGEPIHKGAQFLKKMADDWETMVERFRIPAKTGEALYEEYHVFTEGIAVSALISTHTHACTKEILCAVESLTKLQWLDCVGPAGSILSWEVMYACRALRDFVTAIDSLLLVLGGVPGLADLMLWRKDVSSTLLQLQGRVYQLEAKRGWRYHWKRIVHHRFNLLFLAIISIVLYSLAYIFWLGPLLSPNVNPLYPLLGGNALGVILGLIGLLLGLQKRR